MFLVVVAIELLDMGAPGVGVLTAAVGAGVVAGSLAASLFVSGMGSGLESLKKSALEN